ncbi:unnamed protein product, partial [marine sediment metagenome]
MDRELLKKWGVTEAGMASVERGRRQAQEAAAAAAAAAQRIAQKVPTSELLKKWGVTEAGMASVERGRRQVYGAAATPGAPFTVAEYLARPGPSTAGLVSVQPQYVA